MSIRRLAVGVTSLLALGSWVACGGGESGEYAGAAGSEAAAAAGEAMATSLAAIPQDAYARMLPVPDKLPDDPAAELMLMAVRNASVPSASAVGVPAYPGARVLSTMAASEMTVNDQKVTSLPALALLANDDIAKVAAFYTEKLTGWDHEEFYGNHMFWQGPEGSNPLDITGQFPVVGLVSLEETDTERAIWPEVRTRIDIRYMAGGQ